MTLKEYTAFHRPALEKRLLSFLATKQKEFADKPLYLQSITKLMETVTEGKLIRGVLILLAYESYKHTITKDALTLAAAIELFHTGLLIHDDIMDNDYMRRGKPTVFAKAIEEGKILGTKNAAEYGNAIAICIGDLSFFMAYELISKLTDTSHSLRVLNTCSVELQKVGFAQITDVHFGINEYEPSEEEILMLYKLKTARYSFSLPLKLGGILAGCDESMLKNFETFGEMLGIAFQIKDDELGIFGNEELLGKPIGSDIRENKKTLLRHTLFKSVDEESASRLRTIYGRDTISKVELKLIRESLKKHNVLKRIQKVRKDTSLNANNMLQSFNMNDRYKHIFADLVDFTNNRDK